MCVKNICLVLVMDWMIMHGLAGQEKARSGLFMVHVAEKRAANPIS